MLLFVHVHEWGTEALLEQTEGGSEVCCERLLPASVRFDQQRGLAMLTFDADNAVRGCAVRLNGAMALMAAFGPALRAIVIHISGFDVGHSDSRRSRERMDGALDALHALSVPIVCSSDCELTGSALALWSAVDYRITTPNTSALEARRVGSVGEVCRSASARALRFACWLSQHPAIGMRHMHAVQCRDLIVGRMPNPNPNPDRPDCSSECWRS